MKKNNYTIAELQTLLREMALKRPSFEPLKESEVHELDIHFEVSPVFRYELKSSYDAYFLCTDGVGRVLIYKDRESGLFYFHQDNLWFSKIETKDWEEIAKRYQEINKQVEKLLNEQKVLNVVLSTEKVRGFFLKNKFAE